MAKLEAIYDETTRTYRIIDIDAGVEVVALDNKNVADNFVKSGVVTPDSVRLAVRQDIATTTGLVSEPGVVTPVQGIGAGGFTNPNNLPIANAAPVVLPFGSGPPDTSLLGPPRSQTPAVQPFGSGGFANPNNFPVTTGNVIYNTTDDPESQKVFAELKASQVPPPPLTRAPVAQSDPPEPAAAPQTTDPTVPVSQIQAQPASTIVQPPYDVDGFAGLNTANTIATSSIQTQARPVGGDYVASYDVETGKYDVVDLATGLPIKRGLSEQAAILDAENLSVGDPGYGGLAARNIGVAYDDDGFLLPGYTLDENNDPVYVGGDFVEPATAASAEASRIEALKQQAQNQATVSAQRKANGKAVGDGDWRVRLRLAPNATYLYKSPGLNSAGIMEPLRQTDGVVFPYTPQIDIQYSAEYTPYDLVHTNYRGYFYKGSRVGDVVLNADFTAQDSNEADYLLAVIHFFRSCTKMFYGQDKQRGTPPPLVFLSGLGTFQFNEHPCVISQFNYNLPKDVDYIRSRGRQSTSSGVTQGGNGLMFRRTLASSTAPSYSLSSIWSRLTGANLPQGGMNIPPAPPNLGLNTPSYVPTKMSMSLTLLPMPTRSQISQQFSLEKYANGNLLRGGFW